MRKIRGALPMTAAVQSLNPVVLKNIERSNINLGTYAEIQAEVRAQGMQSYGELILCLPGETKASVMRGISDLLDAGVSRVSAHQLMLLHGAPLSNPESRARFGLKSRFRVVARNLGNYTGEPVIETEEMVVETDSFSFRDYLETRIFHLLLTIFYYEGNYEEAFELARQEGLKPFDVITRLQALLNQAPAGFRRVIDDFVRESQDELFSTRDECLEWARRNFDALVSGAAGGNLLSKYSMLGRFYATQDSLTYLATAIASILEETGRQLARPQLDAVIGYLHCALLHVPFAESLDQEPVFTAVYDVDSWRCEGYAAPLSAYRLDAPLACSTAVNADRSLLIRSRIAAFGEHPSGLGKFTRTMFARDLRRDFRKLPGNRRLPADSSSDNVRVHRAS
jgi:hypothetical protein